MSQNINKLFIAVVKKTKYIVVLATDINNIYIYIVTYIRQINAVKKYFPEHKIYLVSLLFLTGHKT